MQSKQAAGLIYGPDAHHLDHLAVICSFMEIPLIATDEEIASNAKIFYPHLDILLWDYVEVGQKLVSHFDIIFYSIPRILFDEAFFFQQMMHQKKINTIWCPHGNSDKGNTIYFMEELKNEEIIIAYGKRMVEFLKRKNVYQNLKKCVLAGNLRYLYYLQNKDFYDRLVGSDIARKLPLSEKTVLYAPTWQDFEKSSSFSEATDHLIKNLPGNWNLIVKLHPNLLQQEPIKIQKFIDQYEDQGRVLFLKNFPPVYPILNISDIYIGDMSSIGYDFLTFNRPMFFLNQNLRDKMTDDGLYLFRCGIEVRPEQYRDIYKIINIHLETDALEFSDVRKAVYSDTFSRNENWKEEILNGYSLFDDFLGM